MRLVSAALVAVLLLELWPVTSFGHVLATPAADSTAAATATTAPAVADSLLTGAAALARARELLREGDYDPSIDVLKHALAAAHGRPEELRPIYLLLIKTYVFLGNDLKFRPQGREASNLNYQEAKRLIAECLTVRALRHTQPEPTSEYPPEMVAFFAEVRAQMFGAFRVLDLSPAEAVVLFDGDTLRATRAAPHGGDVDIMAGAHEVRVRAPGYKETVDAIRIAPGATVERSYTLDRRRGGWWYATRGAAALALIGGAIAAFAGGNGSNAAAAEPLPGAPPPPTH